MEKRIIAAVKSVLPDIDVYHDYAPEEAALPLVIIRREGGAGNLFLNHLEDGGYAVRFYLSVWTDDRLEAVEYSRLIENALLEDGGISAIGAAVSVADSDTGKRGMGQDFIVIG